jgi:hypothetical protein
MWLGLGLLGIKKLFMIILARYEKLQGDLAIFEFQDFALLRFKIKSFKIYLRDFYLGFFALSILVLPAYLLVHNFTATSLKDDYSAQNFGRGAFEAMSKKSLNGKTAVIIPEEAETTFTLRYYKYFEYENRNDVIVMFSNGIYDSSENLKAFKERYPQLVFPDHPTGISVASNTQGMVAFIKANWDKYQFFYARGLPFPKWGLEQEIELQGNVMLSSVGPIYKVRSKNATD